jgi:hypothetical protein
VNLPQPPTNWDIERLTAERTEAVGAFGFAVESDDVDGFGFSCCPSAKYDESSARLGL